MGLDTKCVFFDMEGTLFARATEDSASIWTLIAQELGPEARDEEQQLVEKWLKGKFRGYVEFMEESIRVHQKYGLTREVFKRLIYSVPYHHGVDVVVKNLKERGCRTALISGGFKALGDRAQEDLRINHSFCACEYFWDESGRISHWNSLPCDFDGKRVFMELLLREYGFSFEECVFVGDGMNDVALARAVGTSIAFNAHDSLREVSTFSIDQPSGKEDFSAVLDYIR